MGEGKERGFIGLSGEEDNRTYKAREPIKHPSFPSPSPMNYDKAIFVEISGDFVSIAHVFPHYQIH